MVDFSMELLLFCILLIIILIFVLKSASKKKQRINELERLKIDELKEYFKEETKRYQRELNLEKDNARIKAEAELVGIQNKINNFQGVLQEKEKRYMEVNQDLDLYRKGKIEEIDKAAEEYKEKKEVIIDQSINNYREQQINKANEQLKAIEIQKKELLLNINTIKNELEEERSRRAAINEELRKQEEHEKYNEIHSVNLSPEEKEDIHFLLSLEDKLHNKQILYKLVWSTYLQQAYKNTFHNILGNRDPKNVVYCIENINTGKKYIGKTSAEVSKRWTEHVKTSLNIGTIKSTNIHKALYNHWDEFIFYIIAETDKEKLSETEKYYIQFYESDKYGYNIKVG